MTFTAIETLESRWLLTLSPVGDEQLVPIIRTLGYNTESAVADNGSYVIAAGGDNRIAVNRYNAAGQLLPGQAEVFGYDFDIDTDADGDSVIVWDGSTSREHIGIFFRTISKDGAVSEPRRVFETTGLHDQFSPWRPAVSMSDDGRFFLGYIMHFPGTDTYEVRMRAYNANGTQSEPEFVAERLDPVSWLVNDLDIAAYPDGSGAAVVYDYEHMETEDKHVEVLRVNTTSRVGDIYRTEKQSQDPSVALVGERSFVVSYTRPGSFRDTGADFIKGYVQRFDANAQPIGAPVQLGTTIANGGVGVFEAWVDRFAAGGFIATFTQGGGGATTYVSNFSAAGVLDDTQPIGSPVDVARVAGNASGQAVLAYRKSWQIFQQRFTQGDAPPVGPELQVLGTKFGEIIHVVRDGAELVVRRGDTVRRYDPAGITSLSINGFGGADSIWNETDLPATIGGGDGNDVITGGSSKDSIRGESGYDLISGGGGNDILKGDAGNDSVSGNAGNDTVHGGDGDDRVGGNGGRDRLFGNAGHDRIFGDASGDWLYGQGGGDQLYGEGGLDRLYADDDDQSTDHLHGNAGDDVLVSRDTFIDFLFGDGGRDSAFADEDDELTSIELNSSGT